MPTAIPLSVVDAREATRARQPGRADLRGVIVTVTQVTTGLRQAVRVAAPERAGSYVPPARGATQLALGL